MSVHRSTCLVCGTRFEKGTANDDPNLDSIAETMVAYLSRRHHEKTGHAVSTIVKNQVDPEERLPPIRVKFDVKKLS